MVDAGGAVLATAGCSTGIRISGATIETGAAAAGAFTTLFALSRVEAGDWDASILLVGVLTTATGELILDDDDFRAAPGSTLFSVTGGSASGCAVPVAGATAARSGAEVSARDCAPPLLCATPLRGSSLAVDPIEVVPVMLVELAVDDVDVDPPTGVLLDGGASDSAGPIDEDVVAVDAVESLDDVPAVEGVASVDDVEEESVVDEFFGSAHATPGVVATATPTPRATAKPPTRPTYLA